MGVFLTNRSSGTLGFSKVELLAMTVFDLRSHPERLTRWQMNLANTDQGVLFETVHYRKDGTAIPVEVSSVSTNIEGESVLLSIVRDISERKAVEAARNRYRRELYEAKERFQVTLQSIGDAVIATDTEARVTLMNPVAEDLTGWSSREAIGRPLDEVFSIVNEESRQQAKNAVETVLTTGKVVGLANHIVLIARDGTERPIADSAAPIVTANKKIDGVVLFFRDTSEEKRAQALLAASEKRYRTTFENTGTAMAVVEADTTISHVNRQRWYCLGMEEKRLRVR